MTREAEVASTKRNDVNGWFICRDDEIARRYIPSEGGNVCASSSVKSCRGFWTIVYTISRLSFRILSALTCVVVGQVPDDFI